MQPTEPCGGPTILKSPTYPLTRLAIPLLPLSCRQQRPARWLYQRNGFEHGNSICCQASILSTSVAFRLSAEWWIYPGACLTLRLWYAAETEMIPYSHSHHFLSKTGPMLINYHFILYASMYTDNYSTEVQQMNIPLNFFFPTLFVPTES